MSVFVERGKSEYLGEKTQPTYGVASWAQQHKCKASGLFLPFRLQVAWKKTHRFL